MGRQMPSLEAAFLNVSPVVEMAFSEMSESEEHRFKLYTGVRLENMVDSIRKYGIMEPLLLWHTNGRYLILSGYNRRHGGILAGLTAGPVRVFEDITPEIARAIMFETNLFQRSFSEMDPMEQAYCISQHYKNKRCQGKRSDLLEQLRALTMPDSTSPENQAKLRTDESLGKDYGLKKDKMVKFIRIGESLTSPGLCDLFGEKKIALTQTYHLSFMDEGNQNMAASILQCSNIKVSPSAAKAVRQDAEKGPIEKNVMKKLLSAKMESKKPAQIAIKSCILSKYFEGITDKKQIQQIVDLALAEYFKKKGA